MIKRIINFLTRSIDIDCVYCKKRMNIKKRYAHRYVCCSDACGYKFFTGVKNLYFEERELSDEEETLL